MSVLVELLEAEMGCAGLLNDAFYHSIARRIMAPLEAGNLQPHRVQMSRRPGGAMSHSFSSCPISQSAQVTIGAMRVENGWQEMIVEDFIKSLGAADPPNGLTPALRGLWWDAKGNWARAHECAQVDEGQTGSWVHAYLHRKEGDRDNAAYWYRRAGKPVSAAALEEEWQSILKELLA